VNFQPIDPDYVRRLAERDPDTEKHFTQYFGGLLRLKIRARVRSWTLAEDILQETLARVLELVNRKGVASPDRFGAFVSGVCSNVIREFLRKETGRTGELPEGFDPVDGAIRADQQLVTEENKRLVAETLSELNPKDRDLLRLVYFDDADKDDACEAMGADRDYLRVLIHRAKIRFRDKFVKKRGAGG
jgi:RNA polymerase sigma-70 factor (ECF subfamily)